ncbi:MAG: V-type ATP synthase subunit E [Candidatus Micrarchaeia archaeon]
MALDNLVNKINKDAKTEAESIEKESEKIIKKINDDTKEQIAQLEKEFNDSIAEETNRISNEYISNAELSASNIIEEAKSKAVNEEYNRIKHILSNDKKLSERYANIFEKLLLDAKQIMEDYKVKAGKQYKTMISKKHPELKVEDDNINGVIILSKDGKITIDATIDSILNKKEEEIKKSIYTALFNNSKQIIKGRGGRKK